MFSDLTGCVGKLGVANLSTQHVVFDFFACLFGLQNPTKRPLFHLNLDVFPANLE